MEKERRAEERRRDREMQKALNAQEKAALKAKQREGGIGAMDDEELEWELLAEVCACQGDEAVTFFPLRQVSWVDPCHSGEA